MLALATVVASCFSVGAGHAAGTVTKWVDHFDTLGPLPGDMPTEPYEIKRGSWDVVDIVDPIDPTQGRRVLRQGSILKTPNEPIVYIRDTSFRNFAVQVTAALIDDCLSCSVGFTFRAPILSDHTADPNNLYLFTAINTGYIGGFPTGKAFMLWKRVGQGYFMLSNKISHTNADLTQPHDYKVIMSGGRIEAYVDGRLIIEHRDKPSGDTPTNSDPFPGLPFDEGAIGLRTSAGRAWFDDLIVIADDAYEGRSALVDSYLDLGVGGEVKKGAGGTVSRIAGLDRTRTIDTGYVYDDMRFDEGLVRTLGGEGFEAGASLQTFVDANQTVVSRARINRLSAVFADPTNQVSVLVEGVKIDATATASCEGTTSRVDLARSEFMVTIAGDGSRPDTVIGPFSLSSSYPPNSLLYTLPGTVQVIAHRYRATTEPQRVETSALAIIFPGSEIEGANGARAPDQVISIGSVVAGRYCIPDLELT
ncbi:MAG TPA: hypothetical protein VGB83_02730 [Actinomycetota bacterium]